MGRIKATPKKQQVVGASHDKTKKNDTTGTNCNVQIMGRVVNKVPLDLLAAYDARDFNHGDDDTPAQVHIDKFLATTNNNDYRHRRQVSFSLSQEEERQQQQQKLPANMKKRKQRLKKFRHQPKSKRPKSKISLVEFQRVDTIISTPEVRIQNNNKNDTIYEGDDDKDRWMVIVCPSKTNDDDNDDKTNQKENETSEANNLFLLQSYTKSNTIVEVESNDDTICSNNNDSISITTKEGIQSLLNHCKAPTNIIENVTSCIRYETIVLNLSMCNETTIKISLFLTDKALQVATPSLLPMSVSTSRNKIPATSLQRFMTTLLFKTSLHCKRQPIAAKQVYSLVDNVQLQQWNQQKQQSQSIAIPGLVPKLRPYQEAAVHWMLHREYSTTDTTASTNNKNIDNDEWELAWMVLFQNDDNDNLFCDNKNSTNWTNHGTFKSQSLIDYHQQKRKVHDSNQIYYYYCPFAGWWAKSYDQARLWTLGQDKQLQQPIKGGILAESMGLGKTVEVIACILANPAPQSENDDDDDSNATIATVTATRTPEANGPRIVTPPLKDDNSEKENERISTNNRHFSMTSDNAKQKGFNTDQDDDVSSSDEEEEWVDTDDDNKNDNDDNISNNNKETEKLHDVIWLDSDKAIGTCICGELIHYVDKSDFTTDKEEAIVICESCKEPMHLKCSNMSNDQFVNAKQNAETIVAFRKTYQKNNMKCVMCPYDACPCCLAAKAFAANDKQGRIISRATLIVTPPAILHQWEREIHRHTSIIVGNGQQGGGDNGSSHESSNQNYQHRRPLKVVIYPGIQEIRKQYGKGKTRLSDSNSFPLIHPKRLADADVVLMTFDALRNDLGHSDDNPYVNQQQDYSDTRSLRYRKIYRVIPSPLSSIHWWRVCLDEAQRVETPTADSAKMALKLHSEHRWCVSGTPVGKGKMDDLYGLMLFLRHEPFSSKLWFNRCFTGHMGNVDQRIQHLLRQIFWRSTKASAVVREQMGVPEQIEKKIILQFSSIEKHFYDRQLETTLNIAGDIAESSSKDKGPSKRKTSKLEHLSNELHKLRAACCHPQVGSSGMGMSTKRRRVGVAGSNKRNSNNNTQQSTTNNAYSRILTMDQILDRLIDDTKLKCEEAQRLALMHTNAMAVLCKLKIQAKSRGINFPDSDGRLITHSCKYYLEALQLSEENSTPDYVIGEAVLSGCIGFRPSNSIVRGGKTILDWQIKTFDNNNEIRQVWSRIDFEGLSKRITEIRVRPVQKLPSDLAEQKNWVLLQPKECVFQVGSVAVGGEFVNVVSFELENDQNDWSIHGSFRTNKSKNWRVLVKSFHDFKKRKHDNTDSTFYYVGLDVELCEASIANDSLQRLHSLHNACESFEQYLQLQNDTNNDEELIEIPGLSDVNERLTKMKSESELIERLYMDGCLPLHRESQRQLKEAVAARETSENKLLSITKEINQSARNTLVDCFDDTWWYDMLSICSRHGTARDNFELCRRVQEDLNSALEGSYDRKELRVNSFPAFHDVNGLTQALDFRYEDLRDTISNGKLGKCLKSFTEFTEQPREIDVLESSQCQRCKVDWTWEGAMCGHCKLSVKLDKLIPDRLFLIVVGSIHAWMKGGRSVGSMALARTEAKVDDRAKLFFEVLDAYKKERSSAERAWRVHLDLLNDLDELNMCKRAIRLSEEGEDLSKLPDIELNAVVHPIDIATSYMDHGAKQAMALANLRRHKSTLRYLKNQNRERRCEQQQQQREDNCMLCLCPFDAPRSVLACGHSFHASPCLERLMARQGNQNSIACPLRCSLRTKKDEILIASDKRRDDGSKVNRRIVGSWGTKVTRLVADVLDVSNLGEKSIVFSMWDDMLSIVEEALSMNNVSYVRATTLSKVSESTRRFRSSDCSVLLLNVKNGAEGLTLLEATHIFMVEPLLNHGLDSQAISRIHRIGQTCKTFIHRYLIEGTIEMKIDKLRMEKQEDSQMEESIFQLNNKDTIKAGGIDGGFATEAELLDVLKIN